VISLAKTVIYPAAFRYLSELSTWRQAYGIEQIHGIAFEQESAETVAALTKRMVVAVSKWTAQSPNAMISLRSRNQMQYCAKTLRQ
jgi:glutamine synthetase